MSNPVIHIGPFMRVDDCEVLAGPLVSYDDYQKLAREGVRLSGMIAELREENEAFVNASRASAEPDSTKEHHD